MSPSTIYSFPAFLKVNDMMNDDDWNNLIDKFITLVKSKDKISKVRLVIGKYIILCIPILLVIASAPSIIRYYVANSEFTRCINSGGNWVVIERTKFCSKIGIIFQTKNDVLVTGKGDRYYEKSQR